MSRDNKGMNTKVNQLSAVKLEINRKVADKINKRHCSNTELGRS